MKRLLKPNRVKAANAINVPRIDGEASVTVLGLKDGMCILSKS